MASFKEPPPPLSDDYLQRAFVLLAYRCTTFTAAMADPLRRQIMHVCAKRLLAMDMEHNTVRTVVPERRIRLGVDGHPIGWCTQMVAGPRVAVRQVDFFNQPEGTNHT